jgi:hypothetical protein
MKISVFDGVFSSAACSALHGHASARGLGHALFPRGEPLSPLEVAMDSFLDELGEELSGSVEYWSRQEWKHLEAHADVDEALASSSEAMLRCPEHAHVLYLSVGPRVRGPTCVWSPSAQGGRFGALTAVPAVAGRVLRFDGRLQHAVPRPADVWLAPFVVSQTGPAEDFVRSVVLFNVWPEGAPPLGVPCEDDDEEDEAGGGRRGSWRGAGGEGGAAAENLVRCAPRAQWVDAPIARHAPGEETAQMKLWLLGDRARRGQLERTLKVGVDGESVQRALEQTKQCTRIEELDVPRAAPCS